MGDLTAAEEGLGVSGDCVVTEKRVPDTSDRMGRECGNHHQVIYLLQLYLGMSNLTLHATGRNIWSNLEDDFLQ